MADMEVKNEAELVAGPQAGPGAPFSADALGDLSTEPEAPKKRRGRPRKKSARGPGRPTREEVAERKLTAEEQERKEIAELLFQVLGPINPDANGAMREFHYSKDQLQMICEAAAPVWLKYMPTGPSKYSEEAQLLFAMGITVGPKFAAYRARRIQEGNPIRFLSRGWQWIKGKFTRKKAPRVHAMQGDGYA